MRWSCLALLLLASLNFSLAARDIILLGDSLSDNSRPHGYTGQVQSALQTTQIYPQSPYYNGRWSSGPVWIEFVAKTLGSTLTDFGGGGATTGTAPAQLPPLPVGFANLTVPTTVPSNNLFQQYDQLLLSANGINGTLSSSPLYVIFIGTNDFLSIAFQNTSVTSQAVASNIQTVMSNLYSKGALDFLLVLLPSPVSTLPVFTHPSLYGSYSTQLPRVNQQIAAYNTALQQLASTFPNGKNGVSVSTYNWGQAFQNVVTNAANYKINNTQDACYLPPKTSQTGVNGRPIGRGKGTTCPDPLAYIFWDEIHPTALVHQAIGANFVDTLGQSLFGVSNYVASPPPAKGPSARGPVTARSPPTPRATRAPPTPKSPPTPRAPSTPRAFRAPPPVRAGGPSVTG